MDDPTNSQQQQALVRKVGQTLEIVGSLYFLTALAGIFLALRESRQFLGIGALVGMAAGIFVGAGYSASLYLLLLVNACHTPGANCA